jgi:uncharacterized protein (DUF1697 family)
VTAPPADARILLLRGINLGPNRRIAMPQLRAALSQAGNVVLRSDAKAPDLQSATKRLIEQHFGLDVPVIARTGREMARVIDANPLAAVATDPKRHQVTFLSAPLADDVAQRLQAAAAPGEAIVVDGQTLYAWHPDGVARSKLWNALAGRGLGVVATSRNFSTVQTLATMAAQA